MVIGTPESWDPTISLSGKRDYGSCTWSPCGQFIAAQAGETVEIRNPLTFELLTVLKSTKYTPLPMSPLVYSPDGRSLARGFSDRIVIWDIQTGGVAKEINLFWCTDIISTLGLLFSPAWSSDRSMDSIVWSLDGSMVAITLSNGHFIHEVETYNVFSGVQLFTEQFKSLAHIYLWAHEKSFRLIEAVPHFIQDPYSHHSHLQSITYTISEIRPSLDEPTLDEPTLDELTLDEPTLIGIESSSLTAGNPYSEKVYGITFSASTYRIAILGSGLLIYDIRTSHRLLDAVGYRCTSFQFSPDGSRFASFYWDRLSVFQWTSGRYTLLWQSLFRHEHGSCLQFSPTSSSVLSQHDGILQVRRLSDLPITSKPCRQSTVISRSGRRIATAHRSQSKGMVTIIDLHSRAPPQFIDTDLGLDVEQLAITGNVLVVMAIREAAGWLLTEEGAVDGMFGDQRASDNDRKWTFSIPKRLLRDWDLKVEGKVGVIHLKGQGRQPLFYHIENGDVLDLAPEPQHFSPKTSPEVSAEGGLHYHLSTPL